MMAFLLFVCQLALLDDLTLLPIGILLFNIGIPMTIEEFSRIDGGMFGDGQILQDPFSDIEQEKLVQKRIQDAEFEYHVLREQFNVQIVPIQKGDGSIALFAM
jgi:hypothetical protein